MKLNRTLILTFALAIAGSFVFAQVQSGQGVRKRAKTERNRRGAQESNSGTATVSGRMQNSHSSSSSHDADLAWMREIYREINLEKDANFPLYYPEDVIDGQENLFRLIFRLVVSGELPAYEYLDGREVFTDQYKIKVGEMLDRYGIYYTGSEGNYNIEEADVPSGQVLNYYILERWEFDRRSNRMTTKVVAICPVLNKIGDYGGEARYPLFWVKFDALQPYLAQQYVFLNDDNNLPQYSLYDYFNLGMYDGDIYKTKNLRNLSMVQMYPDPDERKAAQDSIDRRLRSFGDNLWVPSREEYLAAKAAAEEAAEAKRLAEENPDIAERELNDSTAGDDSAKESPRQSVRSKRATKKTTTTTTAKKTTKKSKGPKLSSPSSSSGNEPNSSASKSVRRRKR